MGRRTRRNVFSKAAVGFSNTYQSLGVSPKTAYLVGRFNKQPNFRLPVQIDPCVCLLEADSGITVSTGVSRWFDLSPYANHTDSSAPPSTSQPSYNSSPPYLTFDGSNDYLAIPNSSTTALNTQQSAFVAIRTDASVYDSNSNGLLGKTNNTTGAAFYLQLFTDAGVAPNKIRLDRPWVQAGSNSSFNPGLSSDCTVGIIVRGTGSGQHEYWVNGTLAGTGQLNNGSTTTNPLYIGSYGGADRFFRGRMYSVAIYNGAISQSEAAAIHWYFNKKYYS